MLAVEGGDQTDHCKMSAMQDTMEERITCDVHVVVDQKSQQEFDHSLCSLPSSVQFFFRPDKLKLLRQRRLRFGLHSKGEVNNFHLSDRCSSTHNQGQ